MRPWCESLDLDPEFISEVALDLIDLLAVNMQVRKVGHPPGRFPRTNGGIVICE